MISKKDISKDVKYLYNDEKQQSIVIFPMIHIGKKEYFESAKTIIDSLRKEGYIFYYENIKIRDSISSDEYISYKKKMRKLIGFNTAVEDKNSSLPNYYLNKKYMIQDYNVMGLKKMIPF